MTAKTRLTNSLRTLITNAVMADVPTDKDAVEAFNTAALAVAVKRLPPEARVLWNNPILRPLLNTDSLQVKRAGGHAYYDRLTVRVPGYTDEVQDLSNNAALSALVTKVFDVREARASAESAVKSALEGVATVEQLKAQYPEIGRYYVQAEEVANLPAVTDITDKLKAAGWPKGAAEAA